MYFYDSAVTKAVLCLFSLFLFTSCYLSSSFIHTQTNKQTNCFPLPPGPLPAVLMSTGKGQKQPCHKDLC